MTVDYIVHANNNPIGGTAFSPLWGDAAPDGDANPWKRLPVGTPYFRKVTANQVEQYVKVKDDNLDGDWRLVEGIIAKTILKSAFTDGGAAAGTYTFTETIPAGAYAKYCTVQVHTGFTGDTSAALIVGDGTDTDRYNTGTPSVLAAGHIAMGDPSGTKHHTAAKAPVLTVTSAADFTAVAGTAQLTVAIHYGS